MEIPERFYHVIRKLAACLQIARAGQHHRIAIHHVAVFVCKQRAVSVAVEGEAQ
jgi:hypothetical protein